MKLDYGKHIIEKRSDLDGLNREQLYEAGLSDGLAGRPLSEELAKIADYHSGWIDGDGDRQLTEAEEIRPVDDDYYVTNSPPTQFDWAGVKRTPREGEFYLSKMGNPNYAWKERGNAQKRHILVLQGHEGHKVHPETDKKTSHMRCETCQVWINLTLYKV